MRGGRRFLLVVAALMISACGAGNESTGQGDGGPEGEPSSGGTLRVAVPAEPTGYPILQAGGLADNIVGKFLTEGLTRYSKDSLTTPEPALATSWESNEDATVWTFELRDDVTWHDGEPFTAEDVKFTFDLITTEGLGARSAGQVDSLKSVKVVDEHTVRMTFAEPHSTLPIMVGYNMGILPKHILEGEDPANPTTFLENPIGTGPFKFESSESGSNWVMTRNDDWWGGEAYLDQLVFTVVPDMNATVAQLRSGDIDVALVQPRQAETLSGVDGLTVSDVPQVNYFYVATMNNVAPFDSVKVRQALNYAVDKEAIVETVLRGFGEPAAHPIPPALDNFFNAEVEPYPYDPDKAMELLTADGWVKNADGVFEKDGQPLSIELTTSTGVLDGPQLAEILAQQLQEVGIQATIDTVEFAHLWTGVFNGEIDASVEYLVAPPSPDLYNDLSCDAGRNRFFYCNQDADALLLEARATTDLDQQRDLYGQYQEMLNENPPGIYLYYPQEVRVLSSRLGGFPDLPLREAFYYVHEMWVESAG